MLNKITKGLFILLATIPLLKENFNSMIIILCALFTLISCFTSPQNIRPKKSTLFLMTPFFLFLIYELLSGSMNDKTISRCLPFLIFPLIYDLGASNLGINKNIQRKTLFAFQLSTLLQSIIYVVFFLMKNPLNKFFASSNNIPFFREYVAGNYWFNIHPTYFSSFLLVSFTISIITVLVYNKRKLFNAINAILMVFFILLFASRMIFILMIATLLVVLGLRILKVSRKQKLVIISSSILVGIILMYPFKEMLGKRLKEITTEINKPVSGEYYNSTNTRVVIFQCTYNLLKESPFFGYGDNLQKELDNCYKENYPDSVFYKKQQFNTHNYYLHLIGYGGWLFFITFMCYLYYVYKRMKISMLGVVLLFQLLAINITENFLSRHYGIVLFCFLTSLIIFTEAKKQDI
jgi:O-antigen ligase